jgi:hypothetical protein
MNIKAMKKALNALETHGAPLLNHEDAHSASLTALRQAIAEAEKQEPDELTIAYMSGFFDGKKKREWVSLTDEEFDDIYEQHHNQYAECISVNFGYERAIEAKLREKNGC